MCKIDPIDTTAVGIECVNANDFVGRISEWQRELWRSGKDAYTRALITVLDTVLDEFFDCCSFME